MMFCVRVPGAACIAAVLAAASLGAQTPPAPVLSCETVSERLSVADVKRKFGDLDTPERQVDIRWADTNQTRLASITSVDGKSVWRTGKGVKVGMSVADLDTLNGRTFQLRAFETEDPGRVLSWSGGKLEGADRDGCFVVVRLAPTVHEFSVLEWRLIEAILSTPEVSSDDRRIKPYKATVASVGLEWR